MEPQTDICIPRVHSSPTQQLSRGHSPVSIKDRWTERCGPPSRENSLHCKEEGGSDICCDKVSLEDPMLSDIGQTRKDKYYVIH